MKATLIDFEDSFTFNLVQELNQVGFEVTVVPWRDFEHNPKEGLLIFGPGPGHPDDYQRIYPLLRDWLNAKKPFFGVCLGHQILWRLQNEEIFRSKYPLHGQSVELFLTPEWKSWLKIESSLFVQRYNSLAVLEQAALRNPFFKNFIQNEEILITRSSHILTYQFHPESIGTCFRKELCVAVWGIIEE